MDKRWRVTSPNGYLALEIALSDIGRLQYFVQGGEKVLLEKASVGIITEKEDFTSGLAFVGSCENTIDEVYSIPAYKAEKCHNFCNALQLEFQKNGSHFVFEGRAYNDGVAFRELMLGDGMGEIRSEVMSCRLPKDVGEIHAQKYAYHYGECYDTASHADLFQNPYGMPMLVRVNRQNWMLLTEADIMGHYCGSHLQSDKSDPLKLEYRFAHDQIETITQEYPMRTPWRVAMIGTLADIVASCLIENLNPPCVLEDTSWIKPGWSAWSCLAEIKIMPHSEMRMHERDYIDLAARMGWPYNALDWLWPKLDIPALVAYAKERGIALWLWGHRREFMEQEDIRAQLSKWSEWGIVGIKIDFFDSDSQASNQIVENILKIAAEYKLMVNFHGSAKPAGEQRTYPHLLTRESLMGAEAQEPLSHYLPGPDAAHNCILPFTMNAVGPQDYTPIMLKTFPSFTTDMHQFALAVVLESHIQHYADSIDMLDNHPARGFLKAIPASWDETRLLEGFPAKYVTIARRKGGDWYIGSLCARKPRVARITLDFLETGCEYDMTVYADGYPEDTDPTNLPTGVLPPYTDEQKLAKLRAPGAHTHHQIDPHAVKIYSCKVRKGSACDFTLLTNGGLCAVIKKRN